jgi:outer membrane protein
MVLSEEDIGGMDRFSHARVIFVPAVLVALICFATAARSAEGAENDARPTKRTAVRLALAEAVGIALNRNLRISDAILAVQESEHRRRSSFSDFFPSLNMQYLATGDRYRQPSTVGRFAISQDARRGGQLVGVATSPLTGPTPLFSTYPYRIDPYRTFTLVGTLTQPLYTGGRLMNNYKYYRLDVDYNELQFEVARQDLILEVYEAYYQMLQSEKLLEVADQSIRALVALRNQTLEFYKAGVVPKVDVLATEGQLANARIQRTQAVTDIERYRANLNFLLRYPQETPIDIVQDLSFQPAPYQIPGIYRIAAANRIEIRQANISVAQAMALVKSASADLIPSVTLQFQGTRTNDDWNPFDPEAVNEWQVQGIVSWAFDMFRSRETVQERRTSQARTFVQRELLVEQIMNDVKTAYVDMKKAESDIADNRKAVEYRQENFRINQERYKEQVATYVEVLDAQRQLAQSQGDYYISLMGYKIGRAFLERRMGILR